MIEYRHINADEGIETRVARIDRGYSVTLRDTDADIVMPLALIFDTLEAAIAKADEIATGNAADNIEVTL